MKASAVADTSGLWLVTRNNAFTNSATYMEQHRYTTDAPPRSVDLAGNHKPEEITGFFHRFEADFDGFLLAVDALAPKYTIVELVTPATDLELENSSDYLIGPSGWHRRLMFSNAGVPMSVAVSEAAKYSFEDVFYLRCGDDGYGGAPVPGVPGDPAQTVGCATPLDISVDGIAASEAPKEFYLRSVEDSSGATTFLTYDDPVRVLDTTAGNAMLTATGITEPWEDAPFEGPFQELQVTTFSEQSLTDGLVLSRHLYPIGPQTVTYGAVRCNADLMMVAYKVWKTEGTNTWQVLVRPEIEGAGFSAVAALDLDAGTKTRLVTLAEFPALITLEDSQLIRVDDKGPQVLLTRDSLIDFVEAGDGYFLLETLAGFELVRVGCQLD